jgi:hypothetical protein
MASIRWPVPWDGAPNVFEIVGRYVAQTIQMERFVDMILLHEGVRPERLIKQTLAWKIERVGRVIAAPGRDLLEWSDLEERMAKVARNRNAFAHRLMERSPQPSHYGQGLPDVVLSDAELEDQVREAFTASELCRQLVERLLLTPLNPGHHFGRTEPSWPP